MYVFVGMYFQVNVLKMVELIIAVYGKFFFVVSDGKI